MNNVGRIHRTPHVVDWCVRVSGYPGDIRQLAVRGLGHERPTPLLTNQMGTPAGQLVDRYAPQMEIENASPMPSTSFTLMRCPQRCR